MESNIPHAENKKDNNCKENCDDEEEEEGIHTHCLACHSISCNKFQRCPIVYCPEQCGVQFHKCKRTEHVKVCRHQKRPCLNSGFGCPFKVTSIELMNHLERCPANVVYCSINWNRTPLFSVIRDHWLPFHQRNPVCVEGQLDVELAQSDQDRLTKEYRHRIVRGYKRISPRFNDISSNKFGRIEKSKIRELEELLTGKKHDGEGKLQQKDSTMTRQGCCSNTDFITYDQLGTIFSKNEYASNTNMRDSYFEVPNSYNYNYNGIAKKLLVTANKSSKKKKFPSAADSLSKAELEARKLVIQNVKLSSQPLGLNVTLERLPVYFDQYPFYRFICGALFRRDQIEWHRRNSHCDISSHLKGWLTERCPLAIYGCPHVQFRLKPKSRTVKFSWKFACFKTPYSTTTTSGYNENSCNRNSNPAAFERELSLLDLPTELLVYLMFFLDNLSMNCLAKTCTSFRNLCCDMVDELGIVVTDWCKKSYTKSGSTSWQEDRKIRMFTTSFSPVREWTYNEVPSMGQHLKTCAFFNRNSHGCEKVKLPVLTNQ